MKRIVLAALTAASLVGATPAGAAEGVITYKSLSPDVAFDLARAALNQCRKDGYQVAVVVVVILRDRFAGSLGMKVAQAKARAAQVFARNTSELVKMLQTGEISRPLGNLPGLVFVAGGLVIQAEGSTLGAVGVSGASGGDKDEACAKAGLAAIQDKLEF
ncbi:MAG: heme-binding protein [Pseudolabrys sp.]